jgi:hypothetical protein
MMSLPGVARRVATSTVTLVGLAVCLAGTRPHAHDPVLVPQIRTEVVDPLATAQAASLSIPTRFNDQVAPDSPATVSDSVGAASATLDAAQTLDTEGVNDVDESLKPPDDPPSTQLVLSGSVVRIEWEAAAGSVSGYRIRRNGDVIAELSSTARSFTDSPTPGQPVTYQVVAFGPGGASPGRMSSTITLIDETQTVGASDGSTSPRATPVMEIRQVSTNVGGGLSTQKNSVVVITESRP